MARERSAKPLYTGSNPVAASRKFQGVSSYRAAPFFVTGKPCFGAYPEDQHGHAFILDSTDDAPVTNSVFPEFPELRAMQRAADAAGIVEAGNSFV